MANYQLNYREIIPNQTTIRRWKDIKVDTGAAQSTLQDIMLPECAGGFTYRDSNRPNSVTRHRFIYWKISHDVLELTEQSLDYNLHGNQVRFRFEDTPVLEGVSIHETNNHVIVLVATVFSVHRLIFAHPNKLQRQDFLHNYTPDHSFPSVFADASAATGNDSRSQFVFELTNNTTALPHSAASWLTSDGDAVFAIASHLDRIIIVRLPSLGSQNLPSVHELRCSSVMQWFWTGIIPASIRGGRDVNILNVCTHLIENDLFVFALTRDCKIRQWSCTDYDCVMVFDVLDLINDTSNRNINGPQNHSLRKALNGLDNSLYLGIYLCFSNSRHICVLQSVHQSNQHQLELVQCIQVPECHMIDFTLTEKSIFALWSTGDEESSIYIASIEQDGVETWTQVVVEASPERELDFQMGVVDPREAFMEKIFSPGNFSIQTITKAISIYRRSSDASFIIDINVPVNVMKEEVTSVVEKAIQMQASEYEMQDADYFNLQLECWSKFYSCCVQYHEVEAKIMGLVVDPKTGLVCVVKKSHFSLLRPQDSVEMLCLSDGRIDGGSWLSCIVEDENVWADLSKMAECLSLVGCHVRDDIKDVFECELMKRMNVDEIVSMLLESFLISSTPDDVGFLRKLTEGTNSIGDFVVAVEVVLAAIDLAHGKPESLVIDERIVGDLMAPMGGNLFGSDVGCSLMAKAVYQMARLRFDLCRNLMFYFNLLMKIISSMKINAEILRKIEIDFIPQTEILLRSYFILVWASETTTSIVPRTTLETGLNQLALLNITDTPLTTPTSKPEKPSLQLTSLVELFIRLDGGNQARSLLTHNLSDLTYKWSEIVTPIIQTIGQLLWPLSIHFAFPEFLLAHCQYLQLSEYINLLEGWCEWNCASRYFLLGNVYLNLGESNKSLDWFFAASECITPDEFLHTKVIQQLRDSDKGAILTTYYLKVIHLLEQFSLPSQAICVAKRAISISNLKNDNLSTLWCIVFKHQLSLGHYNEAYEAIVNNPNQSRTKDCLRQLVVVLCERKQFKNLIEFPYSGLQDDLVSILESRARSVDLITHNFYDVLYSFHVYRGNYRKAGSIMYEYGMRLGNEVPGLKGLQRQAKCYLTTLNCLRLVDPNYAWIVKSVVVTPSEVTPTKVSMSPKRDYDRDEGSIQIARQMKVLEFAAIQKEYDLLHARLHLFRKEPELSSVTGLLSTSETIGLLVNVGLFDAAIRLCRTFEVDFSPVFEGLSARCVELSQCVRSEDLTAAWDWLSENDLNRVHVGTKTNPADHAWALLDRYLKELENKGQSLYHFCVATKLLALGAPLPLWLAASYKKRNPSELLRLYLDYDLLEDATELCLEYVDAVLGTGKEYFGLIDGLQVTNAHVWVPYTLIDHLLDVLGHMKSDPIYKEMDDKVVMKLEEYRKRVMFVSEKMIELAHDRQKLGNR